MGTVSPSAVRCRLVCGSDMQPALTSGTKVWVKLGAGSWAAYDAPTATLPLFGPWDDGSSTDTVQWLEDIFVSDGISATVSLTSAGYLRVSNNEGSPIYWRFENPAGSDATDSPLYRDALGLPRDEVEFTAPKGGSYTSAHQPPGLFRPYYYLLGYRPFDERKAAQSRSKSGVVRTLLLAEWPGGVEIDVGLERAYPHQDAWNEWHSFRQWMALASQGIPFRLYVDETNADPHVPLYSYSAAHTSGSGEVLTAATANEGGYRTLILDERDAAWALDNVSEEGTARRFRKTLTCWRYRRGRTKATTLDWY